MAGEIVIGGLQLNFTDNGSTKVIEDITSLANALTMIKEASKGGNLTVKAKQIENLAESIDKIKASSVANVTQLADSIVKLSGATIPNTLAQSIDAFGTSVEGVDKGAVDDVVQSVNEMAQIAKNGNVSISKDIVDTSTFEEVKTEAESASQSVEKAAQKTSAFKRAVDTTDGSKFASIGRAVVAMLKPSDKMVSTFNTFKDKMKGFKDSSFVTGLKNIKDGFVKLGQAMFGAHSFAGKLIKSFVRIAFYRSIRFALSSMVKGFKEGATNLYAWSDAFDKTRTFANNMDRIATSILYVKNSLGAMVAPIINAVTPAIEYLSDKFVGLLNIVNEFVSAFTGASTYTVAKRVATSFQDVADGIGDANKQLKSFTIGIDELNIIEDTGADGYGLGGDQKVAEDWFETKEVSNKMKNFADDVKIYLGGIKEWAEDTFNSLKSVAEFWSTLGDENFWEYMKSPEGITDTLGNISSILSPFPLYAIGIKACGKAFDEMGKSVEDAWDIIKKDPLKFVVWELTEITKYVTPFPTYFEQWQNIKEWVKDPIGALGELSKAIISISSPYQLLGGAKQFDNLKYNITHLNERLNNVWGDFKVGVDFLWGGVQSIADLIASGWEYNLKQVKKILNKIWNIIKKIANFDISNIWTSFIGNESEVEDTVDRWGINVTDTVIEAGIRTINASMGTWGVAFDSGLIKSLVGAKNTAYNGGAQIANSEMSGMMSKKTPLMQTSSDLAYYSATTFSSNHNIEQFKSGGMNLIAGAIQGVNAKSGQLYSSIRNVVDETFKEFCKQGKMHSPSKLFEQGGEWIVEGANMGIEKLAPTTKAVISDWYSTFENLKPNVDISNISLPNIADIATSVSGAITASSDVTTQAMTSDLAEFFTDTLMPVIMQISDDAKRQADKSEVITLDGRRVTQSVNRQNNVNGYSFTGV